MFVSKGMAQLGIHVVGANLLLNKADSKFDGMVYALEVLCQLFNRTFTMDRDRESSSQFLVDVYCS